MATCKDCVHYDVCGYHITEETDFTVNECPHGFKNKADFVEVQRGGKHILDATCGSRTIWFDKNCDAAVFLDKRVEHDVAIGKLPHNDSVRTLDVEPDIVADFTNMPFEDNAFELVVFDPPHLIRVGENAWMKKKYGKLPENWPQLIRDGFWECMRVLKPYGTLIFKWSDIQISTREVINAIGKEPLFGHRSGKNMKTHWLCFMKFPDQCDCGATTDRKEETA